MVESITLSSIGKKLGIRTTTSAAAAAAAIALINTTTNKTKQKKKCQPKHGKQEIRTTKACETRNT